MAGLSIKRIKHLIMQERPKTLAKYLARFLPPEKQKLAEVKLDEYAHNLLKIKKGNLDKKDVLKKIAELS